MYTTILLPDGKTAKPTATYSVFNLPLSESEKSEVASKLAIEFLSQIL